MPVNRNALLRYRTIDRCLQNRYRRWTLEDLIEACSAALYEYEGIDKGVSRRTVQLDLQTMRSDKLGYNAPIIVVDKRYYTYADPDYSITNSPITEQDLNQLNEAVGLLKQFKGFAHFEQWNGLVQKLEDHIYAQRTDTPSVIEVERNDDLKGLEHLEGFYQAIIAPKTLEVQYQSFKSRSSQQFVFHPYLLKEFNNRWFVIGRRHEQTPIINLALDRIQTFQPSTVPYERDPEFDSTTYYQHTIGVSVSPKQPPEEVRLLVHHRLAPYVLTKPLHHSQQVVQRDHYGVTISLMVQHNFELERVLLGFGERIQVLAPERLERTIRNRLQQAEEQYRTQVSQRGLKATPHRLTHKGWALFRQLYPWRVLKHLNKHLWRLTQKAAPLTAPVDRLLERYPSLGNYLLTRNLIHLLQTLAPNTQIVDSCWYPSLAVLPNTPWQQLTELDHLLLPPKEGAQLEEATQHHILEHTYQVTIALGNGLQKQFKHRLLSGSHRRLLHAAERTLIEENSLPYEVEYEQGSTLVTRVLLMQQYWVVQKGGGGLLTLLVSHAVLPEGWTWRHVVGLSL